MINIVKEVNYHIKSYFYRQEQKKINNKKKKFIQSIRDLKQSKISMITLIILKQISLDNIKLLLENTAGMEYTIKFSVRNNESPHCNYKVMGVFIYESSKHISIQEFDVLLDIDKSQDRDDIYVFNNSEDIYNIYI